MFYCCDVLSLLLINREGESLMTKVTLEVNGKKVSKDVADHTILSVFLRDNLNLTGTHIGCDTSQCGACVVHVDGKSIKSCSTLAADINGSKVTTIEGLVQDGKMHPMQEAFKKMHGLQCGFCTPGMVMSAIDLLKNKKNPSDIEIREWLEGNICRCTGYQNIVAAVKEAASKM
jgi:carbon-monoxide dehydrogenase small subunit